MKITEILNKFTLKFITLFLGSCDKIKVRVVRKGGSGGRKMDYAWSVSWASSNTLSISLSQTAAINGLNTTLATVTSRKYVINSNSSFIGGTLQFRVSATNFLGSTKVVMAETTIVNKALPRVSLSSKDISRKVSETITVSGIMLFHFF